MTSRKPDRLLILTQYFPPEMGAPQSRLYETARGLQARGWEVEIITAFPNYPTGRIFPAYRSRFSMQEEMDGLNVRRYWLYASNSRKALPRIASMLSFSISVLAAVGQVRRFRPAYLWVESPPLLLGLSGWILARCSGARLALNVSDIWPLSAAELGALKKGSLFYRLLEGLERFLYRRAYTCTGQSEEIVRHLQHQGAARAWLYRNGVDVERFQPEATRSPGRPLKVVYAGLLGVAQGILELCRRLDFDARHIELHLYGDGAERKAIEAYLAASGKTGIVLHQPVGREQVPAMLMQYDLTLIPLIVPIYGAVPSKIYEAMAAGLPILFAGGGEGAVIIRQYDLGWVYEPSDFEAMQAGLEAIARLPEAVLSEKRQNGLRAAREVFSREIQLESLSDNLLRSLSA